MPADGAEGKVVARLAMGVAAFGPMAELVELAPLTDAGRTPVLATEAPLERGKLGGVVDPRRDVGCDREAPIVRGSEPTALAAAVVLTRP